jgi:UDP-N-acetylglucosamine 4,6-dehydratase
MNIMELAKAVCPKCKIEIIGIRPGEKLHEVMVPKDDAINTVEVDDCYIIKPSFRYFQRRFDRNGYKPVAEDFEYNSGNNARWLNEDRLTEMIKEL